MRNNTGSICDRACENRTCEHMKFDYFFTLSWLITFYDDMLWSWHFQQFIKHLIGYIYNTSYKIQIFCSTSELWPVMWWDVVCDHMPCFCMPGHILQWKSLLTWADQKCTHTDTQRHRHTGVAIKCNGMVLIRVRVKEIFLISFLIVIQ